MLKEESKKLIITLHNWLENEAWRPDQKFMAVVEILTMAIKSYEKDGSSRNFTTFVQIFPPEALQLVPI